MYQILGYTSQALGYKPYNTEKKFSRYFKRVYAQWAKCSTNKTVNACVFPNFHTHLARYFDTTF